MCGICGIVNFDHNRRIDTNELLAMRDLLVHRGPDDAGIYSSNNAGLGHRRLSIIDLAGGSQPMCNEDGSIWIVYNGEIYNYLQLQHDLMARGHIFKTKSDTEVILHAYEQFDVACLEYLRGMFAFAIWDGNKKKLFAARDRLGIKPFYYTDLGDSILFSSEIKSLLLNKRVQRRVNEQALYYYLNLRYVPGPHTMFQDIWKLQPGHYLLVDGGKISTHCYWDLEKDENRFNQKNVEEEFMSLLEDCVAMRLMSEVPLGVFLSGGIDSSLVVALMSRISNDRVKTFSVGYEQDFGTNEFNYARLIANKYDTDHHEFPISTNDFSDFMPRFVWHMDEPISDPAAIPLFYISDYSKKHVTVVLSGEGADEILAGYYIYKKMLILDKFHQIPEFLRKDILLNLASLVFRDEKYRRYIALANLPLKERYRGVSRSFMPQTINRLYEPDSIHQETLNQLYTSHYAKVRDLHPLDQMLYVDIKTWLPDDLLMKADKMTMATSQELRVPFLDHKLVEFAFSLAPEHKLNGNSTKVLLRKVAKELLPVEIIKREKKGFPIPINHWFKNDLNEFSRDVLLDSSSISGENFDHRYISYLLENHQNGGRDFSENIWNLLVFEFWYQSFIKPARIGR